MGNLIKMSILDRFISASREAGYDVFLDRDLREAKDWKLTRSLRPRKCVVSGKELWGKKCYKGTRIFEMWERKVAVQEYWIEKHEYLIWLLKGKK